MKALVTWEKRIAEDDLGRWTKTEPLYTQEIDLRETEGGRFLQTPALTLPDEVRALLAPGDVVRAKITYPGA